MTDGLIHEHGGRAAIGRNPQPAAPVAPYTVRAGMPADADAMAALSSGPIAGKSAFIVESLTGRRSVAVVCAGERVAGYSIWDRAFFGRPFVWLLGVERAFRRQGIATQLMREFELRCRGEALFTSTNESNHAMQELLPLLGYRRSGRIENIDPGDPELIYFKPAA